MQLAPMTTPQVPSHGAALNQAWQVYSTAVTTLSAPDGHPDSIPTRANIDKATDVMKGAVDLLTPAAQANEMFVSRNASASVEQAGKAVTLLTELQASMDQYSPPPGTTHQPRIAQQVADIVDAIHAAEVPLGWE